MVVARMLAMVIACSIACTRPAVSTIEPPIVQPRRTLDGGSVVGRVMLEGKPVPYFGIIFSANYMTKAQTAPYVVQAPDGRFSLHEVPARDWDILVVAPRYGTLIAPGHEVTRGGVLDLGDLVMRRGRTIVGRVIDLDGRPVTGATVRIVTSDLYPPSDEMTDISLGNFETRSDLQGRYRFDGVSVSELAHFSSWIVATHGPVRTSWWERVPRGDATVYLVLVDGGAIDGVVDFPVEPGTTVTTWSSRERVRYAEVGTDRRFRFDNLPVGDYRVSLIPGDRAVPLPAFVAVTAGKRSSLAIAAPARSVNVTVEITGHAGQLVRLTPSDQLEQDPVAMLMCTESGVEIAGVSPGRYEVCVGGDCSSIEVTDAARQAFPFAH